MESFSPSLALFAIAFAVMWLFNSINVLREYERGRHLSIGAAVCQKPKGLDSSLSDGLSTRSSRYPCEPLHWMCLPRTSSPETMFL